MGQKVSRHYDLYLHPEVTPFPPDGPKHDPLYGFENGRPEKVMKVTEEELASCNISAQKRDYCAHLLIDYKKCHNDMFPWVVRCEHAAHEYQTCLQNELVDSYKDYERERRLLVREQRIAQKKLKESLED